MSKEQSVTPSKKYDGATCELCIHYWEMKDDKKARCVHPNVNNRIKCKIEFFTCAFYEY